jgi:hypothetical protein
MVGVIGEVIVHSTYSFTVLFGCLCELKALT